MLSKIHFNGTLRFSSLFLLGFVFLLPVWIAPALYFIPLFILAWIYEEKWRGVFVEFKKNRYAQLLILFWLLHLIGVLYSSNWRYGLNDVQQKLTLLIFPIVLIGFSTDGRITTNKVLNIFLIGTIVSGLVCLSNAFYHSFSMVSGHLAFNSVPQDAPYENSFKYVRFAFLYHPTYLSMYFTFSIAILFKKIKESKKGLFHQVIYFLSIIYFSILIYLLTSRAGIATAFLIMIIGVIWLLTNRIKWVLKFGIYGFVVGVIMVLFIAFNKQSNIVKRFNEEIFYNLNPKKSEFNNFYDMRYYMWQCIPDVMDKDWVFGKGTGDFQVALNLAYNKNNLIEPANNNYNAHNQFLETLVSLGFIGLLSTIMLIVYPAYYLYKKDNNFLPILFLVIIAINFLTESMLSRIAGILFFSLFYSLFFCFKEREQDVN